MSKFSKKAISYISLSPIISTSSSAFTTESFTDYCKKSNFGNYDWIPCAGELVGSPNNVGTCSTYNATMFWPKHMAFGIGSDIGSSINVDDGSDMTLNGLTYSLDPTNTGITAWARSSDLDIPSYSSRRHEISNLSVYLDNVTQIM